MNVCKSAEKAFPLKKIGEIQKLNLQDTVERCCTCNSSAMCIDPFVKQSYNHLDQPSGFTGGATFMCANVHMTVATDVTLGNDFPYTCSSILSPPAWAFLSIEGQKHSYLSNPRILAVTGFLSDLSEGGPYLKEIREAFDVAYDVMQADDEGAMTQRITSGLYSKIVIVQLDQRGWQKRGDS